MRHWTKVGAAELEDEDELLEVDEDVDVVEVVFSEDSFSGSSGSGPVTGGTGGDSGSTTPPPPLPQNNRQGKWKLGSLGNPGILNVMFGIRGKSKRMRAQEPQPLHPTITGTTVWWPSLLVVIYVFDLSIFSVSANSGMLR